MSSQNNGEIIYTFELDLLGRYDIETRKLMIEKMIQQTENDFDFYTNTIQAVLYNVVQDINDKNFISGKVNPEITFTGEEEQELEYMLCRIIKEKILELTLVIL